MSIWDDYLDGVTEAYVDGTLLDVHELEEALDIVYMCKEEGSPRDCEERLEDRYGLDVTSTPSYEGAEVFQ